jgi:hypothetical protein
MRPVRFAPLFCPTVLTECPRNGSPLVQFVAAAGDFLCEVMKSLISRGHPRKTKKIGGPRRRAFGAAPSGPPRDVTLRYVTVRYAMYLT